MGTRGLLVRRRFRGSAPLLAALVNVYVQVKGMHAALPLGDSPVPPPFCYVPRRIWQFHVLPATTLLSRPCEVIAVLLKGKIALVDLPLALADLMWVIRWSVFGEKGGHLSREQRNQRRDNDVL